MDLKSLFPSSERMLEYTFKHSNSHVSRNFALKAPENCFHLTFLIFLIILKQGRRDQFSTCVFCTPWSPVYLVDSILCHRKWFYIDEKLWFIEKNLQLDAHVIELLQEKTELLSS